MSRLHRRGSDQGFALIELVATMIVLGVLAGIAIPIFRTHARAVADEQAHADLRDAVTLLETCALTSAYPTRISAVGVMTGCPGQRISLSKDTRLRYRTTGTPVRSFVLASVNVGAGRHQVYCYNSAGGGGVVKEVTGPLATATC